MKRLLSFCLIISLFLVSCATFKKAEVFYSENGTRMIFVHPTEYHSENLKLFSVDATFYADNKELTKETTLNYSVYVKPLSVKQLSETKLTLKYGEELLPITDTEILLKNHISNKKNIVRFTSKISIEDSYRLLESEEPLFCIIEVEGVTYEIEVKDFRKSLTDIYYTL